MEWVQTTGRTVDEAVDAALDELGVHAGDVEVEVLEEPKAGFLGRFGGSEARVRVRLKPISREKPQDRRRGRSKGGGGGGRRNDGGGRPRGRGGPRPTPEKPARAASRDRGEEAPAVVEHDDVPVEEQAEAAEEFVAGLVAAIGLQGEIDSSVDDDTIE